MTMVTVDFRDRETPASVYDLIVLAFLDGDPAVRADIHSKVDRTLKPGEFPLLEGFAPDYLGYGKGVPKAEEMMFTERVTAKEFLSLLNIEHFEKLHSELPSSERQSGFVVVLRLRGRRTPP